MKLIPFYLCLGAFLLISFTDGADRVKKSLTFPPTSLWGLFMAIAVPVDIPDINVFVSYNFEANYHLPINSTEMGDMVLLAPITQITSDSRSFSRKLAYSLMEERFNQSGYPGRECLLRSICEAAEAPLLHSGLLGGIMHVLFTPSASKRESLPPIYYLAERHGSDGDCSDYIEMCPAGLLNSVSKMVYETTKSV